MTRIGDRPSRIESARRRSAGVKNGLALASAVGFVVALVLARISHPGHVTAAGRSGGSASASAGSLAWDDSTATGDGFFDPGAISPSTSTPQLWSGVS